jgi:hypothetical protein
MEYTHQAGVVEYVVVASVAVTIPGTSFPVCWYALRTSHALVQSAPVTSVAWYLLTWEAYALVMDASYIMSEALPS